MDIGFNIHEDEEFFTVERILTDSEKQKLEVAIERIGLDSYVFLKSRLEGYKSRLKIFNRLLDMYEEQYKTFKKRESSRKNTVNTELIRETQAVQLDIISKIMMIFEDLACIGKACLKFHETDSDLVKTYLLAENPYNFFQKFTGRRSKRRAKKLFMYPKNKDQISNIVSGLTDEEEKILWQYIENSIEAIIQTFNDAIQIYDKLNRVYNKYKHGLTQIFPYTCNGMSFDIKKSNAINNTMSDLEIEEKLNKMIYQDIFVFDYDQNEEKIDLIGPVNFSLEEIKRFYNIIVKNFNKIYFALVNTYLSWSEKSAYLSLVLESGENLPEVIKTKIKDFDNYNF